MSYHPSAVPDYLAGGGEMADLVRFKDWSQTPLGPIEHWPRSLRTTISLCKRTERNGPAVRPPNRVGFGSRLLKGGVPRELGGSVALDFAPEGLECHMRLAISGKIAVLD